LAPFSGFDDFNDCTSKMKAKGMSDDSSKKVCGKLQSKAESGKEASYEEAIKSAIDYKDCISQAKEYGHDDEAAQRICDVVTNPDEDKTEDKIEADDGSKSDDGGKDEEARQDDLDNPDNPANNWFKSGEKKKKKPEDDTEEETQMNPDMYGSAVHPEQMEQCIKIKMQHDEALSKDDARQECTDALKKGTLNFQNQFTDPGKLDNYLDTEAIDWSSDEEADYNEKSDTKKIDLSYYDDDINKCVDEQVKNGLSQENARTFCQNLANYNGDGAIKADDQLLPVKYENREYVPGSDTGSHEASTEIPLLTEDELAILDAARDTSSGGRHQDTGKYITGHGENNLKSKPHNHTLGADGPTYDNMGVDESNTSDSPAEYSMNAHEGLDDNDHVDDGDFLSEISNFLEQVQQDLGMKQAYLAPSQTDNDPLEGGDDDAPEIGEPAVTGQ
jgi:hypothetical protein